MGISDNVYINMKNKYIRCYDGALFSLCEYCKRKDTCTDKMDDKKIVECSDFRNERETNEDSSL